VKILSAILAVLLLALSMAYGALYIEHSNLQGEYALQTTSYEQRLAASHSANDNRNNLRLINPHAQMINKAEPSPNHGTATTERATDELSRMQAATLARTLEQKYAILFSSLQLSKQEQNAIRELLMERERILGANSASYFTSEAELAANIEKQQALVANIDRQIAQVLRPEDAKKYELLKDSAYEQFQMNSFYDQLGDNQAVSEATRNNLLLSKLEQKQAFTSLLQASAENIAGASPDEKKYLAEKMHEALHDYKDNYLRNAKAALSEEQFNVLREYEQNQFNEIWQSLQAGWQIEE
jgi:hypothetical protein